MIKFKNTRCNQITKKSSDFEQIMQIETKGVPGFISERTQYEILEYMRKLEWKMEELQCGENMNRNEEIRCSKALER
ncbi:hypothetical protein GC093_23560 [Paenibacillus sp. LMG 31456]|uniref:Uncharacterized protein n=1 Tax=Paenibacillus foliorum TaxID=2654974 RepID=A0A972H086_9BACL|nr:hypothetical protein [Paenibacillus foliorum]NOU96180.1 hypothetical protein [Paenibacillus foliorum]